MNCGSPRELALVAVLWENRSGKLRFSWEPQWGSLGEPILWNSPQDMRFPTFVVPWSPCLDRIFLLVKLCTKNFTFVQLYISHFTTYHKQSRVWLIMRTSSLADQFVPVSVVCFPCSFFVSSTLASADLRRFDVIWCFFKRCSLSHFGVGLA